MPKAVRYGEFGGSDVLRVEEVERPVPGDGQVLVRVKAAGVNPSEAVIRTGAVANIFPSTFPSGQGSDLAGVVEEVGAGVGGFSHGDEVIGFSQERASQGPSNSRQTGHSARIVAARGCITSGQRRPAPRAWAAASAGVPAKGSPWPG